MVVIRCKHTIALEINKVKSSEYMNVVVTGASQGIGFGIAEKFAASGADLFLCSRNMDKHTGWQKEMMSKYGITISSFNADLSKKDEVEAFSEAVLNAWDRIDILVNNAGSFVPGNVYNEPEGQPGKNDRTQPVFSLSPYPKAFAGYDGGEIGPYI